MRYGAFSLGSIQIDDVTGDHDVVIDRGEVSQAEEKALQEISRGIRTHASVRGGGDSVEMPGLGDSHRSLRLPAGDETSKA